MTRRAKVGVGEATRGRATTMGNPYALITTIPREGGFDLVVSSNSRATTEDGNKSVTVRFREDHGPRIGERVMMAGRLVKVAEKRFDSAGRIMVMDEDTHAWMPWEAENAGRAGR